MQVEGRVRQPRPLRQGAGGQNDLVGHDAAPVGAVGDLELVSDHRPGDLRRRHLARGIGPDHRSVAHDGDPVGDPPELIEAVRDVDDADALVPQTPDDLEETVDVGAGEDRTGLVENEQPHVDGEGLGDRHQLLLADRQVGDPLVHDAGLELQTFEERLDAAALIRPVDLPEPGLLASQEDVLLDGEVGEQLRLLVDRGDAGRERRLRVPRGNLRAVDEDDPLVGHLGAADHLDQGGLAGAVLPDQAVHFAAPDRPGHLAQCMHPAVSLVNTANLEDVVRRVLSHRIICHVPRLSDRLPRPLCDGPRGHRVRGRPATPHPGRASPHDRWVSSRSLRRCPLSGSVGGP